MTLDAGVGGTLIDTGFIDASSNIAGGTGGIVNLLGTNVGLDGNAVVNVSGRRWRWSGAHRRRLSRCENAAIQNAEPDLRRAKNVVINADAIDSGTAGNVVVWSNVATEFYGTIYARGGATAGDGGYVEISSLGGLGEQGLIDLSAANGQMGTLLLDPLTITISGNGTTSVPPNINFNTSPTSNLTVLESSLGNTTANIVLQADNSITVGNLSSSTLTLQNNVSITLQTRNDAVNNPLTDSATGGISLVNGNQSLSIVALGTGKITIDAGVNANNSGAVSSHQGAADVTVAGLQTANGAILVDASGDLNVQGNVTSTGTGTVTLTADSAGVGSAALGNLSGNTVTGTVTLSPNVTVTTTNKAITITGANFVMQGPTLATLNSGTATTTIQASDKESIGLGNATGSDVTISNSELQNVTSGNLVIGGNTTGNITANGAQTNSNQAVTLNAGANGATITFGTGTDTFAALTANATAGMTVAGNVTTTGAGNLALNSGTGNVTGNITFSPGVVVTAGGTLTLAATGSMTDSGALTLNANSGVTINSNLTTNGAADG